MDREKEVFVEEDGTCAAIKNNGARCRNPVMSASCFCYFHDPTKQIERHEAQQKGGRGNRATVLTEDAADLPLNSVKDIDRLYVHVINLQLRGEITSKEANSIGYNLFQLVKLRASSNIKERIAALEQVHRSAEPQIWDPLEEAERDEEKSE